jgi:hypothetical protein
MGTRVNNYFSRVYSIWIPLLYAVILIPLFFLHDTFEEWDGVMQFFAGREILTGFGYNGWTSHFWPPLYSLLIGIGSLFIPGFEAAKLISIIASILLLYVAYEFAMELSNETKVGLLTQLFLILNPLYVLSSFQAENHMLDSFFFVFGLLLFLKSLKKPNNRTFFVTGLICGFAGLSRYTSYTLVPIEIIVLFLFLDHKKSIKYSLMLVFGFTLINLPWWYYNTIINGSPLHTWQYMNIGFGVTQTINISPEKWWWSEQSKFNGILDIISAMPFAYFKNFARNVIKSGMWLVVSAGVLAPFTIPAIFESCITLKPEIVLTLLGLLTLFVALVSQAFVFDQVFLSWSVVMTVLSVMFLLKFVGMCQNQYQFLARCRLVILVIVSLSVAGLALTSYRIVSYINDKNDGGELADNDLVTKAIRKYDSNIETKYIMAIHPARAYYAGSKFLMIPLYYQGTVEGLVAYEGLSDRVITYAPKYPSVMANSDLRADFIIYDIATQRYLPQFSYLLNPSSDKIPENFRVVYQSKQAVVYEIIWK